MNILGDRKFVEVPGSKTHELPPLLVRTGHDVKHLDRVMDMANDLIDQEDMIPRARRWTSPRRKKPTGARWTWR